MSDATIALFTFDGDGQKMKSVINGETIYLINGYYEKKGSEITKYYFAGASRIAMRKYTIPQSMTLEYMMGDHLGSTSLTTDTNGALISELRYKAWGETRYTWTNAPVTTPTYELTKYQYTGQYSYTAEFGLHFYGARFYDSAVGRFVSADTVLPPGTQGYDRYAYSYNNPIKFTDPSGHFPFLIAIAVEVLVHVAYDIISTPPTDIGYRAPAPTKNDVTGWTVDRINTNTTSGAMDALKNYWGSSNPIDKAGALKAWSGLVTENGVWDYKYDLNDAGVINQKHNVGFGSSSINYQAVANSTYGIYAAEMGLPQWLAEAGAGAAQLMQDSETAGGIGTFFDDPFDNYWVNFGYWFQEQYGADFGSLTEDDLTEAIDTYEEEYGESPGAQ